jgi:hypothetical protein
MSPVVLKSYTKVSVSVSAILFKFNIDIGIDDTFFSRYRYRYWRYFSKVSLTTLVTYTYTQSSHVTRSHHRGSFTYNFFPVFDSLWCPRLDTGKIQRHQADSNLMMRQMFQSNYSWTSTQERQFIAYLIEISAFIDFAQF